MEIIKKKLNTPSGNVQDIKYLYNIIAGLKRKGGRAENNIKTFEYFRTMINDYNDAKASKYGLSFKPREVNLKVVKHLVAELKYLKLLRKENGYLILTEEGENIASLIENKDSNGLKKVFAKLMMENYRGFEFFLRRIKEVSNGNGVPIPFITSDVFDKCGGDSKKIAETYINIINENYPNLITNPMKLYDLLENAGVNSIEKRTDKINKLQAAIEKFVVSEAFGPNIQSRRIYDFVRSRTTFLEFTNYATFDFDGFLAEITYLISDFKPAFGNTTQIVNYFEGSIYINHPALEDIRNLLKESIEKIYNTYKDNFGYMKISDVRDKVCRELKISDKLFDTYLKELYKEEPHWLSFTYSGAGDKITEKRLPIIFEKPMREFFTLFKINLRR
jgi:hypothetical protein